MAESYSSRNDPISGSTATKMQQMRAGAEERTTDYQAEIEKLRSDMTKLAESVGGTVKNAVQPMARDLEATVARNPTASVAIAAGVGLLLGLIMSRK